MREFGRIILVAILAICLLYLGTLSARLINKKDQERHERIQYAMFKYGYIVGARRTLSGEIKSAKDIQILQQVDSIVLSKILKD